MKEIVTKKQNFIKKMLGGLGIVFVSGAAMIGLTGCSNDDEADKRVSDSLDKITAIHEIVAVSNYTNYSAKELSEKQKNFSKATDEDLKLEVKRVCLVNLHSDDFRLALKGYIDKGNMPVDMREILMNDLDLMEVINDKNKFTRFGEDLNKIISESVDNASREQLVGVLSHYYEIEAKLRAMPHKDGKANTILGGVLTGIGILGIILIIGGFKTDEPLYMALGTISSILCVPFGLFALGCGINDLVEGTQFNKISSQYAEANENNQVYKLVEDYLATGNAGTLSY